MSRLVSLPSGKNTCVEVLRVNLLQLSYQLSQQLLAAASQTTAWCCTIPVGLPDRGLEAQGRGFPPGPKCSFHLQDESFHVLSWSGNTTRELCCIQPSPLFTATLQTTLHFVSVATPATAFASPSSLAHSLVSTLTHTPSLSLTHSHLTHPTHTHLSHTHTLRTHTSLTHTPHTQPCS